MNATSTGASQVPRGRQTRGRMPADVPGWGAAGIPSTARTRRAAGTSVPHKKGSGSNVEPLPFVSLCFITQAYSASESTAPDFTRASATLRAAAVIVRSLTSTVISANFSYSGRRSSNSSRRLMPMPPLSTTPRS